MSKSQIKSTLKREIKTVNNVIDHKILRGLPYAKEAHYHKALLARLILLNRTTLLARTMQVATAFML